MGGFNVSNLASAQYGTDEDGNIVCINCVFSNGATATVMTNLNRNHEAILDLVEAGTLTIADAD
jgi:hypothetical protein